MARNHGNRACAGLPLRREPRRPPLTDCIPYRAVRNKLAREKQKSKEMDIKLEVAEEEYILPGSPPPSEQFEESEETPVSCLLPDKSRPLYEISYKRFLNWQRQHHTTSFSQRVLIEYFTDLSKKWKSSTLWSEFSKVGKMLKFEHNVDVGQYRELKAFLKQMSVGYKAKKCKTLTGNDVERYWNEAPDQSCLAIKVSIIK